MKDTKKSRKKRCSGDMEFADRKGAFVGLGTANSIDFQEGGDAFLEQLEAITAIQSEQGCLDDEDEDNDKKA